MFANAARSAANGKDQATISLERPRRSRRLSPTNHVHSLVQSTESPLDWPNTSST